MASSASETMLGIEQRAAAQSTACVGELDVPCHVGSKARKAVGKTVGGGGVNPAPEVLRRTWGKDAAVARRFPQIESYEDGMLEVGDGNRVYWEVCGDPHGRPAVVLHGGPGAGMAPGLRGFFDQGVYRVVSFDQRNCGRSTPSAADPATDLSTNTTAVLVQDIERLREHLGVDQWLVFGVSWGTTLALAYAQQHPDRVAQMLLLAVTTTTRREVEWITREMGRIWPEAWARFRNGVPDAEREGDLATAYHRLLESPDAAVREAAARDWCAWEDVHVSLAPGWTPNQRFQDPAFRTVFARLVTHYWSNAGFLPDGQLLRETDRIAHIPAVLINGRQDVSGPSDIAWQLHQRWPASELVVIEDGGHGSGNGTLEAIRAALDRFDR
jgi:proline iminopeptidase